MAGVRLLGALLLLLPSAPSESSGGGYGMTFAPNQCAGNLWYKINGSVINGHIEQSFSQFELCKCTSNLPLLANLGLLWDILLVITGPQLRRSLGESRGAFGVYAAEIAHASDGTLGALRQAGVALSTEDPVRSEAILSCLWFMGLFMTGDGSVKTFTQCRDGKELGELSFLGQHSDLFCTIFTLCPPGRLAEAFGWYQSSNGTSVPTPGMYICCTQSKSSKLPVWFNVRHI